MLPAITAAPVPFSWCVALTLLAVAGVLVSQWFDRPLGTWVCKPLASAGFVLAGLAAGALDSVYGRFVFVGLLACAAGDVLLIYRSSKIFLAGIGAFLLGHLAFAAAFLIRGVSAPMSLLALLALAPFVRTVVRWLLPHLEGPMKTAVLVYIGVISCMVALAVGTHVAAPSMLLLVGALAFFLSDLAVARERFVTSTFLNRLWGLPLYYGAQLLLAASVS
jgi:uncharacterized membrane protein YhhN